MLRDGGRNGVRRGVGEDVQVDGIAELAWKSQEGRRIQWHCGQERIAANSESSLSR